MTARTHNAFAFASLVTIAALYPPQHVNLMTFISAIIAADIGALIPDMDTAGNRLWDFLPQGEKLAIVLKKIFYKHRTLTHSLIGFYALYRGFEWLLPMLFNNLFINTYVILVSLMIGIASHLFSDGLTEEGVPLLFPLRISFGFPPIRAMRVRTGGWFEQWVVFPGVWIYLFWFVYSHQIQLLSILRTLRT